MNMLDTNKLNVRFLVGATEKVPINPRRYSLIISDNTDAFNLIIGPKFNFDKVSVMRELVLGEWLLIEKSLRFYVYLHVDSEFEQEVRNGLPLILTAIHYGDKQFFASQPDMEQKPIIVYFLYPDPKYNRAEDWGTFAEYNLIVFDDHVIANSMMGNHILLDEKLGDVNGDGIPDRVGVYGDKLPGSDFIRNIILEIENGHSPFKIDVITELNGYKPTLLLRDFTKNQVDDILFSMEMMFNSLDSKDIGEYGIVIDTVKDNRVETIFVSDRYHAEYRFLVKYEDFYKISILNVKVNKLFSLDLNGKGHQYLSQYYKENGELIKPLRGEVLNAERFIPVISSENSNFYDLLAVHRIIGRDSSDTLGYLTNLLSWNGEVFDSICMLAVAPGIDLIS